MFLASLFFVILQRLECCSSIPHNSVPSDSREVEFKGLKHERDGRFLQTRTVYFVMQIGLIFQAYIHFKTLILLLHTYIHTYIHTYFYLSCRSIKKGSQKADVDLELKYIYKI